MSDGQSVTEAELRTAERIRRGVLRVLISYGHAAIAELSLPNGRRADVASLSPDGELWIVEIKSSIEDFRSDQKWPDYWECCDRLFFAVTPEFPAEILPAETGLILADQWGGEIVRMSPEVRLNAARRKSMTLRFARVAALRLTSLLDPTLSAELSRIPD